MKKLTKNLLLLITTILIRLITIEFGTRITYYQMKGENSFATQELVGDISRLYLRKLAEWTLNDFEPSELEINLLSLNE